MNTLSIRLRTAFKAVRRPRNGFSIIEVLASIAVALIGVLGVMILVPYAVRMSSTGLEIDAAISVARNSYDQFVVEGYRDDRNWLTQDPVSGNLVPVRQLWVNWPAPLNQFAPPTPFSIDPLAVTEFPTGAPNYLVNQTGFPFNPDPAVFPYRIPPANLIQRDPLQINPNIFLPFDRAAADRLCRAADDLVFGDPIDSAPGAGDANFSGPNQYFDTQLGLPLRRQAENKFSWSALAFPQQNASPHTYRIYFLVYKNRRTDPTLTDTIPPNFSQSPHMRFAPVAEPVMAGPPGLPLPPVSTVRLEGVIPEGAVKKDDWVMLVNQRRRGQLPKTGFDWQVAFCRVISYQNVTAIGPPQALLTLDGPGFDFDQVTHETTYLVHLKDVVMVYDRTIVNEGQSNWNLSQF